MISTMAANDVEMEEVATSDEQTMFYQNRNRCWVRERSRRGKVLNRNQGSSWP